MPVTRQQLEAAFFVGDEYHPDLVKALDSNADGQLLADELQLNDEPSVAAVKKRLESSGLTNLQVQGEVTPFSISHNVVNGQRAIKDCASCHHRDSILATPFTAG